MSIPSPAASETIPAPEDGPSRTCSGFDYEALKPEIGQLARGARDRIATRIRGSGVAEIGRDLIAVKDALPHGSFLDWLRLEIRIAPRTAQHYMSVAVAFRDECALVAYLPPTVLFKLASKGTPQLVRDGLLEAIKNGEQPGESDLEHVLRGSRLTKRRKAIKRERNAFVVPPLEATEGAALKAKTLAEEIARSMGGSIRDLLELLSEGGTELLMQELAEALDPRAPLPHDMIVDEGGVSMDPFMSQNLPAVDTASPVMEMPASRRGDTKH
ncbi:DUF3102 domain-containing protein [Methylobacterium sp. WL19]|uniref:DUF3102 domain-containing protein n=1 Tax=Methylobacterium sp. WL19 TaxID=2603896 RepID=UPI0011C851AF|nr:DUF3102 domain-containing protein [Methylobacterium sp. WL19]TXN27388.1 DUF3102 domain-containing protein [Methylobacterium sp. WL19]